LEDGATGFDMVLIGNSAVERKTEPHEPTRCPPW
jgi:hypothetical protein